jgi:hypothetical protein
MAKPNSSSTRARSLDPYLNQPELLTVASKICAPRHSPPDPRVCRLIIDSRLQWVTEPIDGSRSWLYLPAPARLRQHSGCWIVTID